MEAIMEAVHSKGRGLHHMWDTKEVQGGEGVHTGKILYKEQIHKIIPHKVVEDAVLNRKPSRKHII